MDPGLMLWNMIFSSLSFCPLYVCKRLAGGGMRVLMLLGVGPRLRVLMVFVVAVLMMSVIVVLAAVTAVVFNMVVFTLVVFTLVVLFTMVVVRRLTLVMILVVLLLVLLLVLKMGRRHRLLVVAATLEAPSLSRMMVVGMLLYSIAIVLTSRYRRCCRRMVFPFYKVLYQLRHGLCRRRSRRGLRFCRTGRRCRRLLERG